ncbi:MAG: DUF1611 domain-containing protein [Pseudomonadota bacterium]
MPQQHQPFATIKLDAPYALFLGAETQETYVKTAIGVRDWCNEKCIAQVRLTDETVDLGLPDVALEQLSEYGVKSLLIGTASVGGGFPDAWLQPIETAVRSGVHIISGLHSRLRDVPALVAAAQQSGAQLIDVRVPPASLPVGTGQKRAGKRLLTVGTDCAVGKKYTALAIARAMQEQGWDAQFRATGQTGIMIAGGGIPIDAVISDFITGAAELISPEAAPDHWDVIEGQGALLHPGYCAVSHGLLVGSQPDAIVVCHEAGRDTISDWEHFALPPIEDVIARNLETGKLTNPAVECVGISVNTSKLTAPEADDLKHQLSEKHALPVIDPVRDGAGPIVATILERGLADGRR